MNPAETLEEVVTRLTPEKCARLLFAESLAASHDVQSARNFAEPLRQRLREVTSKSEVETLSEAEGAEYVVLAEQLENADAASCVASRSRRARHPIISVEFQHPRTARSAVLRANRSTLLADAPSTVMRPCLVVS
jgi:hypothetical protein